MASRVVTKKFLSFVVAVLIFTLCTILFLELSYVEEIREEKKQQIILPRNIPGATTTRDIVINTSNPTLIDQDGIDIKYNMDDMEVLKSRKRYELRLEKNLQELWWYARQCLNDKPASIDTSTTLKNLEQRYKSLLLRYHQLNNLNSDTKPFQMNWNYWKKNFSAEAILLMNKRLDYLQNPSDCKLAKKLVCKVAKSCGFGCQMHHVSYCFIMAYATQRTLILDSSNWRYSSKGWNAVFQPISSTCTEVPMDTKQFSITSSALTVALPPVDSLTLRPAQLPMAIPSDLSDRLLSFHGSPFVWFISQFLQYLMKPSSQLENYLTDKKKSLGIKSKDVHNPIVGVHVRRTDKKAEARYHNIEEYMKHVGEWFERYEFTNNIKVQRRIYIATDEPTVINDAHEKYSSYEIISDWSISSIASKTNTRYSTESLFGVIFDVTILSECDYIVCTFSSQVCRLAYELMQNHHIDASNMYYSLDDIYYFGGQQAHDVIAIEDHDTPLSKNKEISFKTGDYLGISGNEKNGYSVGIHRQSHVNGQYPSYKVEEHIRIENFPTYHEVN